MTQRRRLDAFLAEQAAAAGAEFRDGVKVDRVAERDAAVDGGRGRRAGIVVGADGANGTTARALGLGGAIDARRRVRGQRPVRRVARALPRRAVVELGDVPGGYGWVFPKGDHVNVGVGGWEAEGPRLREHLGAALRGARARPRRARERCAATGCRCAARARRLARGRALLVGDAAGLVDPLSGDGMYEAFVSARLAAERVARPARRAARDASSRTRPRLDAALGPLRRRVLGREASRSTASRGLMFALARAPLVWPVVERLRPRGDISAPERGARARPPAAEGDRGARPDGGLGLAA